MILTALFSSIESSLSCCLCLLELFSTERTPCKEPIGIEAHIASLGAVCFFEDIWIYFSSSHIFVLAKIRNQQVKKVKELNSGDSDAGSLTSLTLLVKVFE